MSQTVTKTIKNTELSAPAVQSALSLLGLDAWRHQSFALYGGQKGNADLVIPSKTFETMGWGRLRYSDAIGLNFKNGQVEFVYDHYNQGVVDKLEAYLAALNEIGLKAPGLNALIKQGYEIRPMFENESLGLEIVPVDQTVDVSLGTNEEYKGW